MGNDLGVACLTNVARTLEPSRRFRPWGKNMCVRKEGGQNEKNREKGKEVEGEGGE